jgi:hypothetical protein
MPLPGPPRSLSRMVQSTVLAEDRDFQSTVLIEHGQSHQGEKEREREREGGRERERERDQGGGRPVSPVSPCGDLLDR